jgi:hypothetical protein
MSKSIKLTQGFETIVDDDDYEYLSRFPWRAKKSRKHWYVVRTAYPGKRTIRMHREIIKPDDGLEVDHINGNTLDNRRSNLRAATRQEQQQNAGPRAYRRYKGVARMRSKWAAVLVIGLYDTEEEAASARDRVAKYAHGDFAYLNFPDAE